MTDAQLAALAAQHLRATTVKYADFEANVKAGKYPEIGPPSEWGQAFAALAQIGVVVPPPPPPSGFAALPVGPLTKSAPVSYDQSNPVTIASLDIENQVRPVSGLLVMKWPPVKSPSAFTIHDIVTQNIGNVPPTSNGTSEAGIWLGQQCNAERLVCDGSWEGLWTGAMCCDSVVSDVTIGKADGKGGYTKPVGHIGLYCEHFTRRVTFKNFDIASVDNGVNIEWWYADSTYAPFVAKEYPAALAGKAGSCELTFDTCRVYCPAGKTGIFADAGTWGCVFKNLTFWGPGDAIGLPNHLAGPTDNVVDLASCTFQNGGRQVYRHDNQIG